MRVRKLADDIIKAQLLAIDEMKTLTADRQGRCGIAVGWVSTERT